MVFDRTRYQAEMAGLLQTAASTLQRDHPRAVVRAVSVWTDPGAAASAVSIDTAAHAASALQRLAAMRDQLRRKAEAGGQEEVAALLATPVTRSENPAEFAFRNIALVNHEAFAPVYDPEETEELWAALAPALVDVRAEAVAVFSDLPLEPDAELGINSPTSWYTDLVRLRDAAI